ncbi:MAG: aminoacyl-tRNA hydrolase [Thermovirgaceae bacterium]
MQLILGLGNPGPRYAWTRHNVGWLVLDALLDDIGGAPVTETRYVQRWGPVEIEGRTVLLVKPLTYMNRSGLVFHELPAGLLQDPGKVLVVYDDIALPFGRIRMRKGGSAGGHNGMKSVLSVLKTLDVPRLRIGIAGAEHPQDVAGYVTSPFRRSETQRLPAILDRAVETAYLWVAGKWDKAMQRANAPDLLEEKEGPDED